MKRFLITFFITLALVVGATGSAPAAHADHTDEHTVEQQTSDIYADDTYYNSETAAADYTATPDAEKTSKDYKPGEKPENTFNGIMAYIVQLFAWLLGVGAITLDNAVYYTVVTMGSYINNLSAVGVTWQIMRDIGNIVIIFGFLVAGIATIIKYDMYGWGRSMLPKLLIAAVFLNFSLFLSEAVIDTGNLFATQFYTQINGGDPAGAKTFGLSSINNEGISNRVMASLGLQTIYGEAQDPKKAQTLFQNYWTIGFMSIILFIIAAFVFFSLAFILIARFVILLFLIIVAPIGFAGLAVPKLESTAKLWWESLFKQTITAPILLLLLYIALRVITDVQFLTGFSNCKVGSSGEGGCAKQIDYTAFITGSYDGFASTILSFLVAMGLLLAVVIISKKMSAFGAAGATALAGKLSFGATAWAGRGVAGTLVGRGLLGNRFIKRGAVSDNKAIRYGSRLLSFTGKRLQNRTFDVRNMPGAKTGIGALGLDVGVPSSLTAKQLQEKQYGVKPVKEFFRESSLEHDKAAAELDRKQRLASASALYGPLATPQQTADAEAARRELKKMSTDELAALGDIRKGIDSLVWNLSPSAFADLMKSDKLTGEEKRNIKNSWDEQFSGVAGRGSAATAQAMIGRLTTSETASLGGSNLTHANTMPLLDTPSLEAIRRKGDLTTAERHAIYVARSADPTFVAYLAADPSGSRDNYWNV